MYAVVDIETTGGRAGWHRITEVAIIVHDGEKITDTFQTLINPERYIPAHITGLTGITNEMVSSAPRFHEVAKEIYTLTENKIFVAHNVNFDYTFLKEEFASLGAQFVRKKLCTVRLSRRLFPGFPSYSLGNLCSSLGVSIKDRHRAGGDAYATAEVLSLLLQQDKEGFIEKSLKSNSREATLPPNLPKKEFDTLPEKTGVYYFHDKKGKILYIGKAKNIKKRVAGHFLGETNRKQPLIQNIYSISSEVCGNELIALLHESEEIKKHWPPYNRAQKVKSFNFGLYQYEDKAGYIRFEINKVIKFYKPIHTFKSLSEGRTFMQKAVKEYNLCPKLCSLQRTPKACHDHTLGTCDGACDGKESADLYNSKVLKAIEQFAANRKSFAIIGKGRYTDESSVVVLEKGRYLGYGYLLNEDNYLGYEAIKACIKPCKDYPEIHQLITSHISKNTSDKIIKFDD